MTLVTDTKFGQPTQMTVLGLLRPPNEDPATAINAANCLKFISDQANTLTIANMIMLSAAVICVLCESDWAAIAKPKREITSMLARALNETVNANHSVGRSKRYEFSGLAWQISQSPEAKVLATNAVRAGSMESAIQRLAKSFRELASSVAALARHFGTTRSSGRRQSSRKTSFVAWLRKAIEQALAAGVHIQIMDALEVLLSAASGVELLQIAKRLLMRISDDGLREIGEIIARTLEHREARARRSSPQCIALTAQTHTDA